MLREVGAVLCKDLHLLALSGPRYDFLAIELLPIPWHSATHRAPIHR
jgi:hypothetical protein